MTTTMSLEPEWLERWTKGGQFKRAGQVARAVKGLVIQGKEYGFYCIWMKSQPLDSFEQVFEIITHAAVGKRYGDSRMDIENTHNGILLGL